MPRLAAPLLVLGLLVRVWALPQPGMIDVKQWKAWSAQAADVGLANVYGPSDAEILRTAREHGGLSALATTPFPRAQYAYHGELFWADYPPASMVLLWVMGRLRAALDPSGIHPSLHNVLVNLLHLGGSAALAWILKCSAPGPLGWWRCLAFWANPAALLGSVLGYQDPVFGSLAVLAVLELMRGAHVVAATLVAAAGMLKPQASLLLPALLVVLLTETRWRTWLKALLAGVAVGAVALAPWWLQGHLLSALDGSLRPLTESTVSSQALNLWWIVGYAVQWTHEKAWPLARILFVDEFRTMAGWDVQWPSRLLLLAGTLANVALLLRRPAQDRLRIPLAVLLQVHVFALAGTSVHENHTYLALMLAPLLLGSWAKAGRVLGASSALLFLNLFLFEGLGRGVLRDRLLWRLRLFAGLDLTVLVAAAHVAFVVALFLWVAQRQRSGDAG